MTSPGEQKQEFRRVLRQSGNVTDAATASGISESEIISVVDEVEVLGRLDDFALDEQVSEQFPNAIGVLVEYLNCSDDKMRFDAACKLIDIRMTVYKERNKKKIVTSVLRHVKENDGWDFKKRTI